MEFSNPAERGYVTQISASPLSIFLSQTYHYSLFIYYFYFFQITILNSPTQFLSLTLFSSCDLSLGCVACVFVFMVVWPWVWVSLFLWVCGHVCMQMSVMCALFVCFWFGILGLLFRIADVVKMGLLEVRLAIITVFYFIFSVLSLFVS